MLSGAGSAKEIRHYEFDLGDSGIDYAAGDALGVVPINDSALVDALLDRLGLDTGTAVDGGTLGERLTTGWEIRTPSRDLLTALAERDPDGDLAAVLARGERDTLDHWLWGKDVLDLLLASPRVRFTAEELSEVLRPLQPRAYSISSSPLHSPDRIHLTVASVRHGDDRVRGGVCSTFLADRLGEGEVGIYLQPNAAFRVPADDDRPMIMVGPGTGVAPFRAFLHERAARGATRPQLAVLRRPAPGQRLHLRRRAQRALQDAVCCTDWTWPSPATRREKVYVQTRMLEQAPSSYGWLEDGAHFYVCGDATRMAKDVDAALRLIVEQQRGRGAGRRRRVRGEPEAREALRPRRLLGATSWAIRAGPEVPSTDGIWGSARAAGPDFPSTDGISGSVRAAGPDFPSTDGISGSVRAAGPDFPSTDGISGSVRAAGPDFPSTDGISGPADAQAGPDFPSTGAMCLRSPTPGGSRYRGAGPPVMASAARRPETRAPWIEAVSRWSPAMNTPLGNRAG